MENEEQLQNYNFVDILKDQVEKLDNEQVKEERKAEEAKVNVSPPVFDTPTVEPLLGMFGQADGPNNTSPSSKFDIKQIF